MKKVVFSLTLLFALLFHVSAQIGVGTNTPDTSAMLDVSSNNKGFLIPRIALTSSIAAAPVSGPTIGLMIYNTATAGTAPNDVKPGFYYWTGTSWYPVVNKGSNPGDMQYWNGSRWVSIPAGTNNAALTMCNGVPIWGPCIESPLIIQPANNTYEGWMSNTFPTTWSTYPQGGTDQFLVMAWDFNNTRTRGAIKFDYSLFPAGKTVDSAFLYLYADSTPQNGNQVDPMYSSGAGNACVVSQITSTFTAAGFTWNNPPLFTTANQVIIPISTSSFQTSVVNVTGMVANQLANSSNQGFYIRLQTEAIQNSRQWLNSFISNANRRPKMVIYYH